jgi:predicted RNase H-like HicB family nuclease
MKREFNVVVERDGEGFYVASVPELKGCHTQARSLDELMDRIREAAELCLETQGEETENLEFVGVQRLTLVSLGRNARSGPSREDLARLRDQQRQSPLT